MPNSVTLGYRSVKNLTLLLPISLFLFLLFLYFSTLDTGLQPEELRGGDLITHQYAQVQARPSNAPGYPIYTMGGYLWFHTIRFVLLHLGISSPNPMPILSSYSTAWALLALGLLYAILNRITAQVTESGTIQMLLNALIVLFYAVTYFFWYYATTTEQYTSAIAQTLAILYVYLCWQEGRGQESRVKSQKSKVKSQQSAVNSQRPPLAPLYLLAFLCGLSLAHMPTVAFIVPPLVLVILWDSPQLLRRVDVIGKCVLAAFLPLASYLYVYLRGASHPEWWGAGAWQNSTQWFWAFVSTAQGREEFRWGLEPGRAFFGNGFPALIWQELSLPILLVGFIGIATLGRRLATLLYSTLAIYLIFCWLYRYGNWYQVILPVYSFFLIGLAGLTAKILQRNRKHWLAYMMLGCMMAAVGWRVNSSWPQVNSRQRPEDLALTHAARLLDQPLPVHAALFAQVDDTLALQYLIHIWQIRPDLRLVDSASGGQLLQQGRPILATWEMLNTLREELPATPYTLQTVSADWVRLTPPESEKNASITQSPDTIRNIFITKTLSLVGYTIHAAPQGAPVNSPTMKEHGIDVVLFWQLETGEWPPGLSISVRPVKAGNFLPAMQGDSSAIIQHDAAAPMNGLLADPAWREHIAHAPKSIVADAYRLPLHEALPAGADTIQLILYQMTASGFETVKEVELRMTR